MVALTVFLLLEAASIVAGAPRQVSNDSSTPFLANAKAGVTTLQTWYNQTTGLWDTTGWWNSANCLTVLGDLTALDSSMLNSSAAIFNNTFLRAPMSNLGQAVWKSNATKPLPPTGVIETQGFINEYYDDEAWWALGWIQAYDLTHDPRYLDTAADIFEDMTTGWNATCGGVWWDKSHTQNGAIENELFLSVAAHLGRRMPSNASYYREWAMQEWTWFQNSGLINDEYTINNGLDLTTCRNDNGTVWSYNQGVILGGLVELSKLVNNTAYITTAQKIADAAIQALSDSTGVLTEPCEPDCTGDAPQFKGVFMRNLQALYQASPEDRIKKFLQTNANSIWQNDRGDDSELGGNWSGPFSNADATTQSSACDALVAAAAV
ncbi:glycoside hydrolase family 76 protein [Aspergillus carbonarius ITEM 5010]|uniref:Glycoside hydrolase family 76 protein n=1 Tax=Aspergillus carbonarius (strain ITEM 5010) TaxID=602072 RepID=A0A1R3RVB6_ASPC5|nr:glycoside hydrolase family 76 protein [Aspergillus carbonarius ITEM 5010]